MFAFLRNLEFVIEMSDTCAHAPTYLHKSIFLVTRNVQAQLLSYMLGSKYR